MTALAVLGVVGLIAGLTALALALAVMRQSGEALTATRRNTARVRDLNDRVRDLLEWSSDVHEAVFDQELARDDDPVRLSDGRTVLPDEPHGHGRHLPDPGQPDQPPGMPPMIITPAGPLTAEQAEEMRADYEQRVHDELLEGRGTGHLAGLLPAVKPPTDPGEPTAAIPAADRPRPEARP